MTKTHAPLTYVRVEGHAVPWTWGETLFDALMGHGLPVQSACSGHGACGLCVVQLSLAPLPEATPRERQLLGEAMVQQGARLACRLRQPQPYRVRLGAPAASL